MITENFTENSAASVYAKILGQFIREGKEQFLLTELQSKIMNSMGKSASYPQILKSHIKNMRDLLYIEPSGLGDTWIIKRQQNDLLPWLKEVPDTKKEGDKK